MYRFHPLLQARCLNHHPQQHWGQNPSDDDDDYDDGDDDDDDDAVFPRV